MPSTVYFIDLRATYKESFVSKLGKLLEAAALYRVVKKRDLTAVKLHFGELGNTAFIRPVFIRKIVDCIKEAGAVPFLTDANTLYVGTRSDSPHHIATAIRNGFAISGGGCPHNYCRRLKRQKRDGGDRQPETIQEGLHRYGNR